MKYLDLNFCSDPLAVNALPSERYSRMAGLERYKYKYRRVGSRQSYKCDTSILPAVMCITRT